MCGAAALRPRLALVLTLCLLVLSQMNTFSLAFLAIGVATARQQATPQCKAKCGSQIGFMRPGAPDLFIDLAPDGTLTVPQHCRSSTCSEIEAALAKAKTEIAAVGASAQAELDAFKTSMQAELDALKDAVRVLQTATAAPTAAPTPIDGGWSSWGGLEACSITACGQVGTRTKHRACTNPPPAYGGASCVGDDANADAVCSTPVCSETWSDSGVGPGIPWTMCAAGQGQSNTPSATADRTCAACIVGTSFSSTNDGNPCTKVNVCTASEYEKVAPTLTSDRTCETHSPACASHEYESRAPSGTQDRECKQKVCHCPNGVRATGDACPRHGNPKCLSCKGSYHLANGSKQCDANICSCVHGQVDTGADCAVHGATKCTSCNGGYYLEGSDCVALCNKGYFLVGEADAARGYPAGGRGSPGTYCPHGAYEISSAEECKVLGQRGGKDFDQPAASWSNSRDLHNYPRGCFFQTGNGGNQVEFNTAKLGCEEPNKQCPLTQHGNNIPICSRCLPPGSTRCSAFSPPDSAQCSGDNIIDSRPDEGCRGSSTCGVRNQGECSALCGTAGASCASFADYCAIDHPNCRRGLGSCTCFLGPRISGCSGCSARVITASSCAE
jgi:hypothetical protein